MVANVFANPVFQLLERLKLFAIIKFRFQTPKETLQQAVIQAIFFSQHTLWNPIVLNSSVMRR